LKVHWPSCRGPYVQPGWIDPASALHPKFVIRCSTLFHELRMQKGTSKSMILVPLFDLKFLR
jgi:hypothetical protein